MLHNILHDSTMENMDMNMKHDLLYLLIGLILGVAYLEPNPHDLNQWKHHVPSELDLPSGVHILSDHFRPIGISCISPSTEEQL